MSVLVRYSTGPMTVEQYDEALRRVQAVAGEWPPDGLEYHVCFGRDKNLHVIDVWYSRAQFEAFGQWLSPLLEHVGVHLDEYKVSEIYNAMRQ
jgi:hypothetical protein